MERLSRNFPSSIPQVIDNILGKICFTEQVVYRKQSLGAPVLCLILNRLLLSCNSSRLYLFIYFFCYGVRYSEVCMHNLEERENYQY